MYRRDGPVIENISPFRAHKLEAEQLAIEQARHAREEDDEVVDVVLQARLAAAAAYQGPGARGGWTHAQYADSTLRTAGVPGDGFGFLFKF